MNNITEYHFFQKLCALPFVKAIYLYGSRARGDHKERSDIDLAIVCPLASYDDWISIIEIIEEADTLLKIDCVRFDELTDNDTLKENILRDKIVLFSKEKE